MKKRRIFLSRFYRLLCLFLGIVIITGCDIAGDSSTTKQVSVNMQVATGASSTLNKTSTNTMQATDSVSLDNIKLLVRKLELESEGEYHDDSDDSTEVQDEEGEDDDEGEEFELKNQIFDLPLDGSKVSVSTQEVPSGTYDDVELKIGPAEAGSGLEDSDLIEGDADSLRYSMAISGTYGDSAFTFKTHKYFKIEMEIDPPVEVTDSTGAVDIDLQIDPSGWFKDQETGDYLDPSDPANQDLIEANIARSFKAECHRDGDDEGWHEEDGDHHDNGDDSGDDDHDDDNG